jgi:hypothetical protein
MPSAEQFSMAFEGLSRREVENGVERFILNLRREENEEENEDV